MAKNMRKPQPRPSETLLSAYIDDEVDPEDRLHLESCLQDDLVLQSELDTLCHTVDLVKGLPTVPAPRHFVLSPSMVGQTHASRPVDNRGRWMMRLLTAATAVTSAMFAIVLAGNILLGGTAQTAQAPETMSQPQMEALSLEVAEENEPAAAEKIAIEVPENTEESAIAAMEESAYTADASETEASEAEAAERSHVQESPPPAPELSAGDEPETEEALATAPARAADDTEAPEPPQGEGPVALAQPAPDDTADQQLLGSGAPGQASDHEITWPETNGYGTRTPWQTLELVLGLTAAALALATGIVYFVRRR